MIRPNRTAVLVLLAFFGKTRSGRPQKKPNVLAFPGVNRRDPGDTSSRRFCFAALGPIGSSFARPGSGLSCAGARVKWCGFGWFSDGQPDASRGVSPLRKSLILGIRMVIPPPLKRGSRLEAGGVFSAKRTSEVGCS